MHYEDFLIRIISSPSGGFDAQVLQSPGGEGRAPFRIPPGLDAQPAMTLLRDVIQHRRRNISGAAESPWDGSAYPVRVGEELFAALFQGDVRDLYQRSLEALMRDVGLGLRIKISLDPRDPAFAKLEDLPWELLCDPATRQYLGLSHRQTIVRHLSVTGAPKPAPRPERLCVLPLASSPSNLPALNLERERRNLEEALKGTGVEVVEAGPSTLAGLREAVRRREIHILHFMGHGGFEGNHGVLYFEALDGTADPVRGEDLIQKLADLPSLRLVVLNACESARAGDGEQGSVDPFSGVAQALILAGVPAVVAMRLPVRDDASIAFSRTLYERLAAGDPVDFAVAEGRQEIHSMDRASVEWSTPVVFLRIPDGELFPERNVPEAPPSVRQVSSRQRPLSTIQGRATWIFGGLFVAFLFAVFAFAPPVLPVFKQRILAMVSALLAGLFVYFFTGELGVVIRGRRSTLGRFAVKGSGGAAAFVLILVWWLSPWSLVESTDVARLRVLVLGPEGSPVEDARVWTSVGGEPKRVAGGWELDIPVSKLPSDGRVTVHAAKDSAFLSGSAEIRLGEDLAPSMTVRLAPNPAVTVRGIVQGEAGNALEGVRVSVVGHGDEAVTTGRSGEFLLSAHAADGQQVQLRAEKPGYEAVTQSHPAGTFPATLILERP